MIKIVRLIYSMKSAFVILLVTHSAFVNAESLVIGDGVTLEDNLLMIKRKPSGRCKNVKVINVAKPTYPLAKELEQHLIFIQYSKGIITFDQAVLVLADNQLNTSRSAWC
ncbi:MAG: hypothetical protein KUG78_10555 [Kangiellaceae bacterium]|nr:hypothetical protein [Kangiellaceae bacterium]